MRNALLTTILPERIRPLNGCAEAEPGPVLYWMSRDQRADDNWALLQAQREARNRTAPLVTAFCPAPAFLGATLRHYGFMLRGLADNFCLYNLHYDTPQGFPAWARQTLSDHACDVRPYVYLRDRLQAGETLDTFTTAAVRTNLKGGQLMDTEEARCNHHPSP